MISGEEDELSTDDSSESAADQWSAVARPAKVLGVDPTSLLKVFSERVTTTATSLLVATRELVVQDDI